MGEQGRKTGPRRRGTICICLLMVTLGWSASGPAVGEIADFRLERAIADYKAGNFADALSVFEAEAQRGNPVASFWLGTMWYHGKGKPKNFKEARRLYTAAANMGNREAQNNLGLIYRNGDGVDASRVLAYVWFSLAAAQDSDVAQRNLTALAEGMPNDLILQGQQLAEEYDRKIHASQEAANAAAQKQLEERRRLTQAPGASPATAPARSAAGETRYFVQIGIFQNPEGIKKIKARLAQEKLQVLDEQVELRGGRYQRLRAGPFADTDSARTVAQKINQILAVECTVIPVTP